MRGENVALCGEIVSDLPLSNRFSFKTHTLSLPLPLLFQDPDMEANQPLKKVSIDEILEAQRLAQEKTEAEKKKREQLLRARGMRSLDHTEDYS